MALLGPSTARRRRARERPLARSAVALGASLVLNALALLAVARAGALARPGRPAVPVALAPLAASEWERNRAVRAPPPPAPSGKVVELSPDQPASSEPPASSRYLSDRNTRVEHETVSRDAGQYPRLAARPEAGAPAAAAAPPRGAPPERRGRARPPERAPGRRDAEGLRLPPAPGADVASRAGGAAGGAPQRPADLRPTAESLARIAGGPGMDGVGDGLDEGDETWLASREFRYATYLNEMRRAIGAAWYPRVRESVEARDPDGSALFYRERTVVLGVTLGEAGDVKALSLEESSKLDFVDALALAAVRQAGPFPNPPRAMFEGRGEVRIPFAFTIYPADRRGTLRWRPPAR